MENIENSDICFLIPSFNRYEKLCNLLTQISGYTGVNTIIYNDASTIGNYANIETLYTNTKVIKGENNNGRAKFDLTIKTLFKEGMKTDFKYFILIADDMGLCDDFVHHLKPLLDEKTIVNLFSLSDGGWTCTAYIDGVFSISKMGLEIVYNLLPNKSRDENQKSTGVWSSVTTKFCRQKTYGYRLACLNYTLVQHYGNEDSKLHFNFRKLRPIVAHNFYNDFYGNEIKIVSYSGLPTKVKKKTYQMVA